MRMIIICDNCGSWKEFDSLRDKKNCSSYSSYELQEDGISVEPDIESEIECSDEKANISVKDIDDYNDYFETNPKLKSIKFRCQQCGEMFEITFD